MEIKFLKQKVHIFKDLQKLRIQCSGRINNPEATVDLTEEDRAFLNKIGNNLHALEKEADKKIINLVKDNPIWINWLSQVKGVGEHSFAILAASLQAERMPTVSSVHMYCGLGVVPHVKCTKCGFENWSAKKECMKVTSKNKNNGKIKTCSALVIPIEKNGVVERGIQRLVSGCSAPFNSYIKSFLLGTVAVNMLRANSEYRKVYDNYRQRWESAGKGKTSAHVHRASLRAMIKWFLADYYKYAREAVGLPVREPYVVDYLGHKKKELSDL